MSNKENYVGDIIDRYVYDVTRRLPTAQRDDIEKELRGLIEDMLSGKTQGEAPNKEHIDAVLSELGRPSALAAKYRDSKRYLIGPELIDIYFLILKIVLAATAFGITVAIVVGSITTPPSDAFGAIGGYFNSVWNAGFQSFAWVTIVFALIERFLNTKDIMKGDKWKPVDLPIVPVKASRIKRGEPITNIVLGMIFLVLINATPEVFSIFLSATPDVFSIDLVQSSIPIFNLEVLRSMLLWVDIIIFIGIAKEVFRLVIGKYCLTLAAAVTILNAAVIILVIYVYGSPAIWNADFVSSLRASADMSWADSFDLEYIWSIIPKIIVWVTVVGTAIETIMTMVKSFRYKIQAS